MFDKLFRFRAVVQRYLSSPLLQERLEYLQHCANQGYSLTTLRELAADLLLIQNLLGLATSADSLGLAAVQAGVNRWVDRRPRHFKHKNGRRGRVQVHSRALRWLRFLGRLRLPGEAPPAYRSLLEPFADYLRVEKGLAEGTIQTRSPSEIRPHNLTFCRLSFSSNRMWGGWHWPGRPREERGRLGQVFQAFWGLHPERKSFSRLCVAQIICHSACTFPSPRSRNLRNPRASLICPKTGSTTAWRSL